MRQDISQQDRRMSPYAVPVLLLAALLMGCARPTLPVATQQEFVDGANRIILTREGERETATTDTPPRAFYEDARRYFEEVGFGIDRADEETLIIRTQPAEVEGGLMLRFEAIVREAPGGSKLVAGAEYRTGPGDTWRQARWQEGTAGQAFSRAFDVLNDLVHTEMATAVEEGAVTVPR